MHRHWSQRLVALLGAVWFILVGIEPAVFGACPAHGMAGASASHAGHGIPMDHASMQHAAKAGHDAGAPAHQEHQCTCPGSCCGPSVVDVPSAQPSFTTVATIAATPRVAEHVYRAGWTDFVLPFATAPPERPLA